MPRFFIRRLSLQLCALTGVKMVLTSRCSVTSVARSSWSQFFEEFHCRGCGGQEAYRSRPRSFFEKYVLPFLLLQTVRCERCYQRDYVLRTISAREPVYPHPKQSQSQPLGGSNSDSRVA